MLNASSPVEGAFMRCVWANAHTRAARWDMCTFPSHLDKHISWPIQASGCFLECNDVEWVQSVLGSWNHSQLVDIGGNIGFYTLAAAALGRSVTVMEPSPFNSHHLIASVQANRFHHVQVLTLCASDASAPCAIGYHHNNQGMLTHSMGERVSMKRHPFMTMAVRVDDVIPPQLSPTFLKVRAATIDVRGVHPTCMYA